MGGWGGGVGVGLVDSWSEEGVGWGGRRGVGGGFEECDDGGRSEECEDG